MTELILMMGNVGAGKTSLAKSLIDENTVYLSLDNMEDYTSEEEWASDLQKKTIEGLEAGKKVILDGNIMSAKSKKIYITKTKGLKGKVTCYDFGAGDEKQLARRIETSKNLTAEQWTAEFERKKKEYIEPSLEDGVDEIIKRTGFEDI